MKLLKLKTTKNQSVNNFDKELLKKEELLKIIGGTNGGDEDDDDVDFIIEWE